MGPIFNEKVTKKCNLWVREQYMKVLFTEDLVNNCGLKKKKKKRKENAERKNVDAQTRNPNMYKETNHTNFSKISYYFHVKYSYFYHILRLCLVTIFIFYFLKLVFGNIKKK